MALLLTTLQYFLSTKHVIHHKKSYPHKTPYKHLHVVNAHEQSCMMMVMEGSKMSQAEYDLKAMMYSAHDTPWTLQH